MIFAMFLMLLLRLFDLQVVNGDQYIEVTRDRLNVNMIEKAPRGQIYDRYATPLVANRAGYSLQIVKTDVTDEEFNNMLLNLISVLKNTENSFNIPINPKI